MISAAVLFHMTHVKKIHTKISTTFYGRKVGRDKVSGVYGNWGGPIDRFYPIYSLAFLFL